jgi:hypothetical protein
MKLFREITEPDPNIDAAGYILDVAAQMVLGMPPRARFLEGNPAYLDRVCHRLFVCINGLKQIQQAAVENACILGDAPLHTRSWFDVRDGVIRVGFGENGGEKRAVLRYE